MASPEAGAAAGTPAAAASHATASEDTQRLLKELDEAEGLIADLLGVASSATEELSRGPGFDSAAVQAHSLHYLELAKQIHASISSKSHLVVDYEPFKESSYGFAKEVELLEEKAGLLKEELANLRATQERRDREPKDPAGGGAAAAGAAATAAPEGGAAAGDRGGGEGGLLILAVKTEMNED